MKLFVLWFVLVSATAFVYKRDLGLRYGHHEICVKLKNDFVEKISEQDFKQCLEIYHRSLTFKDWEVKTNSWLGLWGWSHLSVYTPLETTEIWESKTQNIGVKLKKIENELVVYKVHPDSVFERGDIILELNGQKPLFAADVLNESGLFKVRRKNLEQTFNVQTDTFFWDDKVEFKSESNKQLLKVPSFRGEFFKDSALAEMRKELAKIKNDIVYVDLRDNIGGNIAAGIRLLSLFICSETEVGHFNIPSREGLGTSSYPISVDQSLQIEHMKKYGQVKIVVPANTSCSDKDVRVLVNKRTASTAELVAQAFVDLKRGLIIGERTSGRMVLSSWDPIVYFPSGFYFSHPYALYKSISGEKIEGEGVTPNTFKTYVLSLEVERKDSFLN